MANIALCGRHASHLRRHPFLTTTSSSTFLSRSIYLRLTSLHEQSTLSTARSTGFGPLGALSDRDPSPESQYVQHHFLRASRGDATPVPADGRVPELPDNEIGTRSKFMAATGLIIGTAVGPGILGLPSVTLPAGLVPSTIVIISCWVYVICSVLLVAELTFNVMAEENVREVSFTSLAVHTLGSTAGKGVAVVYAMLNYALLVACIAGLGTILNEWFSFLPAFVHTLVSPFAVAILVLCTSFSIIHGANQLLCSLMLVSIACLLAMGTCFSQISLFDAWRVFHWPGEAVLRAIPVTVLTLGFHVITPVVCKVIGSPKETLRAILCAGTVPLAMVLAWNTVVLGLASGGTAANSIDPVKLLLSVSSFAGPAVKAFAFAALGTTLIGYALSFPKQLSDTVALLTGRSGMSDSDSASGEESREDQKNIETLDTQGFKHKWMLIIALLPSTVMSIMHPAPFARSLDFAGVYANCFLFGFLPPVMVWQHRYGSRKQRYNRVSAVRLAPKGRFFLLSLIFISLFLGLRGTSG